MQINLSNQKIRQPLAKVMFAMEDDYLADFIINNKDIVLDELNVKNIQRISETDNLISYNIQPNLRSLGKKFG